MKARIVFLITFGLLLTIGNLTSSAQCAMCKSTVESNQKEQVFKAKARAEGLNTGILYLMVLPYIMFGVIGYFWYKNSKKEREEKAKLEAALNKAINN